MNSKFTIPSKLSIKIDKEIKLPMIKNRLNEIMTTMTALQRILQKYFSWKRRKNLFKYSQGINEHC